MKWPIVFLDIDGVLNDGIDPKAQEGSVLALNYITRSTAAAIVVHSSWRYTLSLEGLRGALLAMGVAGRVLDVCDTPRHQAMPDDCSRIIISGPDLAEWQAGAPSDHERAVAIWRWLRDHPEYDPGERFVILDDDPCLGHYVGTEHFICTQATWPDSDAVRDGLTRAHSWRAVKVLEGRR